jgi:hypothetical protein
MPAHRVRLFLSIRRWRRFLTTPGPHFLSRSVSSAFSPTCCQKFVRPGSSLIRARTSFSFPLSLKIESLINHLRRTSCRKRFPGELPRMRHSGLLNSHLLFRAARVVTSIRLERHHPGEDGHCVVRCLFRSLYLNIVNRQIWRS